MIHQLIEDENRASCSCGGWGVSVRKGTPVKMLFDVHARLAEQVTPFPDPDPPKVIVASPGLDQETVDGWRRECRRYEVARDLMAAMLTIPTYVDAEVMNTIGKRAVQGADLLLKLLGDTKEGDQSWKASGGSRRG